MLSRITALAVSIAAIALVLLIAAQPQVVAQSGPYSRVAGSGFAVHPRDMVQFCGEVGLPVSGEHVLYTVPTDRWLVILPHPNGYFGLGGTGYVQVVERFNGTDTERARAPYTNTYEPKKFGPGQADGLGWTFKPGSQIILWNFSSNSTANINWSIFGYLTPL